MKKLGLKWKLEIFFLFLSEIKEDLNKKEKKNRKGEKKNLFKQGKMERTGGLKKNSLEKSK